MEWHCDCFVVVFQNLQLQLEGLWNECEFQNWADWVNSETSHQLWDLRLFNQVLQ